MSLQQHILTDYSGSWRVSLHPPDERPEGSAHGSEALCMVNAHETVVVRNVNGRLSTPGGHPEEGETSEQTMIREVKEEACANVTSCRLIAFARSEKLDGDNAGYVMVRDMYVARVDLLPWQQPEQEIAERMIVPVAELVSTLDESWPGIRSFSQELLELALAVLPEI